MARTPLMRALQRLAREHREAEALGIGPAELRERQAEGTLTRRELVKRGGFVGAAVMLGGPTALARAARATGRNGARVAIVGGGIAGPDGRADPARRGRSARRLRVGLRQIGGRMHSDWSDYPGFWANGQAGRALRRADRHRPQTIQQPREAAPPKLTDLDLLKAQPTGTDDTYCFLGGYYT